MNQPAKLATNATASKREAVLARIAAACAHCGRDPARITLLAVSKRQPVSALRALYAEGQRHFGENYVQEALDKMPLLPEDVIWHHIGPIQSNKTRLIAEHFDWVHGVCQIKHVRRLAEQRPDHRDPLQICVQVNLADEPGKQGVTAKEAPSLVAAIQQHPQLALRGLMTIPPPLEDPREQERAFRAVAELARQLLPDGAVLSMGMSADLEAAVSAGSTLLRIGTALFGPRD